MFIKKIIKASAGTGKTYSLSLEFLNILFSNPAMEIDEIVVITFTKKATAEIRERIFTHLLDIIQNPDSDIASNLKKLNPKIDFAYATTIYSNILKNKDRLRITTIDSFINSIFNSVIAPYLNISDYEIDPEINSKYIPLLFEEMLSCKEIDVILKGKKAKQLSLFENFVKTIIEKRWMFDFSDKLNFNLTDPKKYYNICIDAVETALNLYNQYLISEEKEPNAPIKLKKSFGELFPEKQKITPDELTTFVIEELKTWDNEKITDRKLAENLIFIPKIRKKIYLSQQEEIDEAFEIAQDALWNYLFLTTFLEEHNAILKIAAKILKRYDKIKMHDKIFTYSDISYYSYKYLKEQKITENFSIINLFYEKLSYNTRFLLIDEFQDTGIVQWNIINPIIQEIISGSAQKEHGGTIIVGDEKQAIYGWRGGERTLLEHAKKFIFVEKSESLDISYRSQKVIVDFINDLFGNFCTDKKWTYTPMKSLSDEEKGFVSINICKQDKDNGASKKQFYEKALANDLINLIKTGQIAPSETAVIARTNKQLETIANILNVNEIEYVLESSQSLFDYPMLKPIIFLLKFFVTHDYMELIRFLRSDVVLCYPADLEKIFEIFGKEKNITVNNFFEHNRENEIIEKIRKIYEKSLSSKSSDIIVEIVESFAMNKIFSTELDLKNFNAFMEFVINFERENQTYGKDISGLLLHIKEVKEKKELLQISLKESDAVKLLTIHKSKGLGFQNVFFFFELTAKKHHEINNLITYYRFDQHYDKFNEFYATLNYNNVIKNTSLTTIAQEFEEKDDMEAINNFYVALTRAKNNLFIYTTYKNKDKIKAFFENPKNSDTYTGVKLFRNFFIKNDFQEKDIFYTYQNGEILVNSDKKEKSLFQDYDISPILTLKQNISYKQNEDNNLDYFYRFVTKPIALLGTILHYYLSKIEYDSENTRKFALNATLQKYGALVDKNEFMQIINSANSFLDSNNQYFSISLWETVLTEYSIFDESGKEFRIDRLLINKNNILILDFKTGEVYDENQLTNYKRIIKSILGNNFKIETKFIEIR